MLKAPLVTDGDWSFDGTRIYARVKDGIPREVGVATRADIVARGRVNANAQMLAASKRLAEALNAIVDGGLLSCVGAFNAQNCECAYCNARAALLSAGYTETDSPT